MKKKTERAKVIIRLETAIRNYIRKRDKDTCQKCGKKVYGSNSHCSHVIPKSQGNALRFDEYNIKLLCSGDHLQFWHLNPTESGEWFKNKFPDRWEYLQENRNRIVKLRIPDLEELIEEYQDKLTGLEMSEE